MTIKGGECSFQMIDVCEKAPTRRRAIAHGRITMAPETLTRLREGRLPKGDVLKLAEVAGILAAKRASETLPLCHPLPLDFVGICFEILEPDTVRVTCEAKAVAKTGVEMEALAGVQGALLSIYDLTKGVDPALMISDLFLSVKEGGKSGRWVHPNPPVSERKASGVAVAGAGVAQHAQVSQTVSFPLGLGLQPVFENAPPAAVLTVSDRCARGEAEDRSGKLLVSLLKSAGAAVVSESLVPDEIEAIRGQILRFVKEDGARLVCVTGGTGVSPRDVTPEACAPLWTKKIPGLGELLRARGAAHTAFSYLSRSEVGFVGGGALLILLPGSPKAVQEGFETLWPLLPHALQMAEGGGHPSTPTQVCS